MNETAALLDELSVKKTHAEKTGSTKKAILFFVFVLVPFFRPSIVNDWPSIAPLKSIFAGWLLLVCLMLVFRFIARNGRLEPFLVFLFLYLVLADVATLFGNGLKYDMLTNSAMLLAPALLVTTLDKKELRPFLIAAIWVIGTLVVLELALRMVLPSGIYRLGGTTRWILEGGSAQSRWCFLLVFFSAMLDYLTRKRLGVIFTALCMISIALVITLASATSMIALLAEIIIIGLSRNKLVQKYATSKKAFILMIVFFVLVVIVRIADYLPYEQIAAVLGKDLTYSQGATFTGRTYIWDSVIGSISESPVIGYGYQQFVATDLWQFSYIQDYGSAHDLWLQIGFTAGLLGIVLFMGAVISACIVADKCSNKVYRVIVCGLIVAFLLTSVFENTLNSHLILALSFAASQEVSKAFSLSVSGGCA